MFGLLISGKQKATNLGAWCEWHQEIWPGFKIPKLLTPLQHRATPSDNKYFQELTVPTGLMFSILAFGVGQPKRNPQYRVASANALVSLVDTVVRSGKLQLTTRPFGSGQAMTVRVPFHGCLPTACYVVGGNVSTFIQSWDAAAQA